MRLESINNFIYEPEGFELAEAAAEGSYLHLTYSQELFVDGTSTVKGYNQANVYLNDQGREVLRAYRFFPVSELPKLKPRLKDSRWDKFKLGWWFIFYGLEEILKCLKK